MERVRIPTDLTDEDTFFAAGPVKLSLRQLMLLFGGLLIWYGVAAYFLQPLLGLNVIFGMIACSWIMGIFMALAFMKVRGRPVDVWVAEKLTFVFGARTFVLRDPNASGGINADLERDEDVEALLQHQRRARRPY
jgi:hypothetical protein